MAASKRFASWSDNDIAKKRKLLTPVSTQKVTQSCVTLLREYLREKNRSEDFESLSKADLDEVLTSFYVEVRTKDKTLYKKNSLESIRYGLNRHLKMQNTHFDLLTDPAFARSNESFRIAMLDIKAAGKAATDHHPPLTEADRQKVYTSLYLDPKTPTGLYNKVQYDIRYFFCRRGSENMHMMTKQTFCVKVDPNTGKKFVCKVSDELTKNHRENDDHMFSGFMPATGTDRCPVDSFEKYLSKLDPDFNRLWCYPRDSFDPQEDCWFTRKPVGVNTLNQFMPRLSQLCHLSRVYTNHSLRATGATVLHQSHHTPTEIMAVTGHKSISSLAVYQRTSSSQKMLMGNSLAQNIAGSSALRPMETLQPSKSGTTDSTEEVGRRVQLKDVDDGLTEQQLDFIFSSENEPVDPVTEAQVPVFNKCLFSGPVTININRK